MDEDGHVFVEDRIDDMMITGGGEGLPARDRGRRRTRRRIRGSGHRHPGRATRRVGDRGRRRDGIVSEDDMEARCRERLTDYKIPGRVEFVDELPKTSTRKIDKVSVREEF
jgi:acyl-CoA synthetase (AMP-forming)/AMP-acid ligase II